MKILLVDGDVVGQAWLRQVLRTCGRDFLLARDGEEAWALLRSGARPDACFCNVRLPGMDGFELLRRVRAHETLDDLPFVLVAGEADRDALERASARGASAYLLQPFLAAQARSALVAVVLACRRARSEHHAATMSRIGGDLEALENRLRVLASNLACAEPAPGRERLSGLLGEAVALGLYRCASLLGRVLDDGASPQVLRECGALVQDQVACCLA